VEAAGRAQGAPQEKFPLRLAKKFSAEKVSLSFYVHAEGVRRADTDDCDERRVAIPFRRAG